MQNYQNRGQGTLRSIMGMVAAFLFLDLIVAGLMFFNVKFPLTNTDNSIDTMSTDNSVTTDNTSK